MPTGPTILLLLASCAPRSDVDDTAAYASVTLPQATPLEAGWLRGDLHVHTTHSDGWDTVATTIALAEYLDDPLFLEHNPEYAGNALDYLAISDHRTVDAIHDPDFVSEKLILVPSEEFGSNGHANTPGVSELVHHDPDGDGVTIEDILNGAAAARAQGALFSPNHIMLPNIPWPWDLRDMDTIEVWNSGWALISAATTEEVLAGWEEAHGPASPFFRRAVEDQGILSSGQSLTYYEALLARGVHVGLVGGSDRHAVLLPGFPTTYVRTDEPTLDGLLDGMRARHTYVTRTPASAQLLAQAVIGGAVHSFGDRITVDEAGSAVEIQVHVSRAQGGLLRLVHGGPLESDEAVAGAALGEVLVEADIDSHDFTFSHQVTVSPGMWIYPLVLEPLVAPGEEDKAEYIRDLAGRAATSGDDATALALVLSSLLDPYVLGDATMCSPSEWQEEMLQCSMADQEGTGSFFVPDALDRAMNVWVVDGEITDWCMGAVGSAILFSSGE